MRILGRHLKTAHAFRFMIYINEFLPNPTGPDAAGEWIELWNSGNAAVSLARWKIKTDGGEKTLGGTIGPGKYLLLKRSETKLVLKNTDEKIFLYDAGGKLADQSGFLGSAPEGKSFARTNYDSNNDIKVQNFAWTDPTPGAPNKFFLDTSIIRNSYQANAPLNKNIGPAEFLGLLFGVAVVLAAVVLYAVKQNENLSKLFFTRDENPWQ